jgi:hypothetical protein
MTTTGPFRESNPDIAAIQKRSYEEGFHDGQLNRIAREERWAWLTKRTAMLVHFIKYIGSVTIAGIALMGLTAGAEWFGAAVGGPGLGTAAAVVVGTSGLIGAVSATIAWAGK